MAKALSRADRAKIFAPFAALKGYYELILAQEAAKEDRRELSEDDAYAMSERLKTLDKGVHVHMRYYDKVCYVSLTGVISRIDFDLRLLVVDAKKILFDDIIWVEEYEPEGRETWAK